LADKIVDMKRSLILLFLLLIPVAGFAKTYEENPQCWPETKNVYIKDSPFAFSLINISGPKVTLLSEKNHSLTFDCDSGISHVDGDRYNFDKNSKYQSVENKDWLAIQEITDMSVLKMIWVTATLPLRENGVNTSDTKPIIITNKNENPVRTKVSVDEVHRKIIIQDPTDPSQKIEIGCDKRSGIVFHATKDGKDSTVKLASQNPLSPKADDKYKCDLNINYDYKTGALEARSEERSLGQKNSTTQPNKGFH
jgi:hypothetical protein